ncbi:MAG: 3-hydroxybutyrate dehydrogenase [Gammaproteobacteria bacterium]|nr:3-hydroxybutyrate dehydrogenase [Gammaproteobacteria bacterium]
MTLDGKVCIVTGAARGIGAAIAKRFVESGGRVAIADLRLDAAKDQAARLNELSPGNALAVEMDVTDERQVNQGVQRVIDAWSHLDVLVSNAGIQIVHELQDFPYEEWKRLLAIHLDGAFLTSKACIPHLYRNRGGSIIFMGSVHSKAASPLKAAYVTAKHGLLGLARVIAREGASHGVRANVICPGFVDTPLVQKQIPEQARALGISEDEVVNTVMLGETVDRQFTTVEDVAEVAHLFAAFPSNALTGQSLLVSHGWVMQ